MQIEITKPINPPLLREQLYAAFPDWTGQIGPAGLTAVEMYITDTGLVLETLNADPAAVQAIIDAHDASKLSTQEIDQLAAQAGRNGFRQLPDWSTWTPQEAREYITNQVLAGQTKPELDAWIDANVTTLATAKTALKLLGEELIDLRSITAAIGQAVLFLRDVAIRRHDD